jgi:hypothetical protein
MSSKTDDHEAAVDRLPGGELAEYTRAPCRRLYAIPEVLTQLKPPARAIRSQPARG